MAKPELEFFNTEAIPWEPVKNSPGQYEKILSRDPKTGSHTLLLLSEPDFEKCISSEEKSSGRVTCHEDMWEEVFVLSGTGFGTSLNKTYKNKTYKAGYYACRPPGMKHGPFLHPTGAVCFEIRTRAKMAKPELEFFNTEAIPWEPVKNSPGQYEKILSRDPKTGSHTLLLLSEPDFEKCISSEEKSSGRVTCHEDMWEEVFVLSGTGFGTSLNKTYKNKTYKAGYYACRPPGMKHGPFLHPTGAVLLEVRMKIE